MPMIDVFTLGRDAEIRTTQSGHSVCNLSLACQYGQKGADGKKPTQWIDAALWGKRAESMAPHLKKGIKLCVTIEDLHIESFPKADGTSSTKLAGNIIAITFAGPAQQAAPAPAPLPPAPPPRPAPVKTGFDDMDSDDIPF